MKYEDTDSLYLTCSEECFQESNLYNEVNTELEKDNGIAYLNMAYEEVLFFVVFTEKKKYYSLEYKNKPNFNLDKKIMNRTLKVSNEKTIHQIVEKVLWEN
ncbi:4111_t:CDS:2, partial [Cetraspora pellucida]